MNWALLFISISAVSAIPINSLWEEQECGIWQGNYSQLHQNILRHKSRQRYLISLAGKCGLADNLSGILSQFLFSIFTQRAFLRYAYGDLAYLEDVYLSPNINWTSPRIPEKLFGCMKPPYGPNKDKWCFNLQRRPPTWQSMRYYPMHLTRGQHEMFRLANLGNEPAGHRDVEVVIFSGHRGRVWSTFSNRHHKQQLTDMGLRRETAVSCLFHFLFRLKDGVCGASCTALQNSLVHAGQQGVIRIGIQVRVGDDVFYNDSSTSLAAAQQHFRCAEQYSSSLSPTTKFVYFLISDSKKLRMLSKEKYGDILLTDTQLPVPLHTNCEPFGNCSVENVRRALTGAAAELHLFSLADVHIVSSQSGFGLLGAMIKKSNKHTIFSVDPLAPRQKACQVGHGDDMNVLTEEWSGFRL
eukprot:gene2445-4739_t